MVRKGPEKGECNDLTLVFCIYESVTSLGLQQTKAYNGGNGSSDILGGNIAAVQEAARHVLALTGVADDHLVTLLEAGEGHLCDGVLLVVSLVGREERRVSGQREVDTGETTQGVLVRSIVNEISGGFWKQARYLRHQVSLEFVQVDIQATIETKGRGDTRDDLGDQPVQVGKAGGGNTELLLANLEDGLVVDHE